MLAQRELALARGNVDLEFQAIGKGLVGQVAVKNFSILNNGTWRHWIFNQIGIQGLILHDHLPLLQ